MNLISHDLFGVIMEVCINNMVIKSASFIEHMADSRTTLERMAKYDLKMNSLKCTFGVPAGHFLGFIVHKHRIQIDPKKVESIQKLEEPTCKRDVQKLLGNINYLRWFIENLSGMVDSLVPVVRLKHNKEFIWGADQRDALKRIEDYLTKPLVLRAPIIGKDFRLYIAAQEQIICAALT
jgi:hypothetical protein